MNMNRAFILQEAQKCTDLPSFPNVVLALEQAFQSPDVGIYDVARLVEQDASMAARFLKVANSALYSSTREAKDVNQAVLRLGLDEARRLAICSGVLGTYGELGGKEALTFWKHNLSVAMIAEGLAKKSTVFSQDEKNSVFTAGILHDLGALLFAHLFLDEVAAMAQQAESSSVSLCFLERTEWGIDHAELGEVLARKWDLPSPLPEVIRFHHDPDKAPDDVRNMVQLIHVANFMANNRGFRRGEEVHADVCNDTAFDALGFSVAEIPDLIDEAELLAGHGEQLAKS
ncbi:MAG: HDOD domain-containing protein [Deltaproteobacteria bacterium]|nr:HDOD domain-containing protein [Deltaproteobacteria bacterium]